MPLDRSATQTTATKSATYLVNNRRRVFGTGALPRLLCAISSGAARRFEAKKRGMKPRMVIFATIWIGREHRCATSLPSLDDLVCEREQGWRHLETEHSSRSDIDGQLEFRWCLCRQIARIGTFQDSINVRCRPVKNICGLWSVGDQSPFAGKLAVGENRRKTMLRCRADDQAAMYDGVGVRRNEQTTARFLGKLRHGLFDFRLVADWSCLDLQRTGWRNGFKRTQEDIVMRSSCRIEHDGESMNARRELPKQLQRLPNHGILEKAEPSDVAARSRQIRR